MLSALKSLFWAALTMLILVIAWLSLTLSGAVAPYILPGPGAVIDALNSAFVSGTLYPHIWMTTTAAALGFLLGCSVGLLFGCVMAEFRWVDMSLYPLIFAIQ